ncbi:molybdopterin-binding protein [Caproiciproducens sp. MSJ-32]|uniref:molybdopterin-binding protein n=1 Tax=Caproiciproducens sp. MSJ-32 TaxID=2841527 RepID=UPI001C119243|nr:molybdopterin-binding protein [Caproiciproducens sp. MSJ-32]MBU5454133.1 molybdopterin-binding protein [Caproiciproducens sp. MSJ-32]
MKIINVKDAVGVALCHDITKIVPGEFKGVAFKKGHIIREEDIEELLSLGKDHIYIWEDNEELIHENEAAEELFNMACGEGTVAAEVKEGKIEIFAKIDGLLKIDVEKLIELNSIEEIVLSTIRNNSVVKKGDKIAATKVIPLAIKKDKLIEVRKLLREKIIKVIPIKAKKIAIVTTGSEVYYGRIKDASKAAISKKIEKYNCEIIGQSILADDKEKIKEAIYEWIDKGAELVLCTGGMSVDADDVTPKAIEEAAGEIISYGTPIFPGAMFLVSYKGEIPILGLPGGVIFSKSTSFDVLLPRILAGEKLTKKEIAKYSHGGLVITDEYL